MGEKADQLPPRNLGQIRRVSPADFQQAVDDGTAKLVSPPTPDFLIPQPLEILGNQLFGNEYLGQAALRSMENQCKREGIDVVFIFNPKPVEYSEAQLREINDEKKTGRARMMVYRPYRMIADGKNEPITINNLLKLFGGKNPIGSGSLFKIHAGLSGKSFLDDPIEPDAKYAFPTLDVIPGSKGVPFDKQLALFKGGETRRTAVEAVWDSIFYYSKTNKRLLPNSYDVTSTADFSQVVVGQFDENGLEVNYWGNIDTTLNIDGVVTQR